MPAFPVSVPMEFYKEVAALLGEPFADSYLFGASLREGALKPRTLTAYERLNTNFDFRKLIAERGIRLVKCPPFEQKESWATERGSAANRALELERSVPMSLRVSTPLSQWPEEYRAKIEEADRLRAGAR